MKEIRCGKCNRLMAVIENGEIDIKGETNAHITAVKYRFSCCKCGGVEKGYIKKNVI